MRTVAVIDYGMGNLRSVAKALEHMAQQVEAQGSERIRVLVSGEPKTVLAAERVIFPGVGAIRDCMAELQARKLDDVVRRCAEDKPLLGICLGMQALFDFSEENNGVAGLGVFAGKVRAFPHRLAHRESGERLKVPHMGWNRVHQSRPHPLWKDIAQSSYFYFVHSYYVEPAQADLGVGMTSYGLDFASACARANVFAVQFHPEKSQQAGLRLLANFLHWEGVP